MKDNLNSIFRSFIDSTVTTDNHCLYTRPYVYPLPLSLSAGLFYFMLGFTIGPVFPITLTLVAPKCKSKSSFSLLVKSEGKCRTLRVQF